MAVPYLACMALVAQMYDLPPRVLPAIQRVEGGAPGVASRNRDGSEDLGIMQINTQWIPQLARRADMTPAAVRNDLLTSPCFNISAAGLILRTYLDETGGDLMRAVGNYHSHTPILNEGYQTRVLRSATIMYNLGPWPAGPRRGAPARPRG